MSSSFTTLFVDVGGVLLTNSWNHVARHRAAEHFARDHEALNRRHDLAYPLYEEGKLKVVAISNDGWELATHRIAKFALKTFVDLFIFSCFVHCRKPEPDISYMAMDVAQVPPEAVVYIEEQPMFVEVAKDLGIRAFSHVSEKSTRQTLAALDLALDESGA